MSAARRLVTDLELAEVQCKRILTRLQLLHDAPTAHLRMEGHLVHGSGAAGLRTRQGPWREEHVGGQGDPLAVKGERYLASQIPVGVREDGGHNNAPDPTFSLWGYYSYHIERARAQKDIPRLLQLAFCATRDYQFETRQRPHYHENPEAAATELLRDCEGMGAVEAAQWLRAPVKWVQQQRRLNGRDPDTGLARRARNERERQTLALREEGLTPQQIADRLGVTRQRIQQILAGK